MNEQIKMHLEKYPSDKYFLTVDDFNVNAKKIYERLGYQCVGLLPDFYKKGIDCYVMMKRSLEVLKC
ncbi:MAG: hypothetical protein IJ368_02495 [Oscillospiraceae bacterium]|nr:hypothetical protein [Oscillospiraceae bacterium]